MKAKMVMLLIPFIVLSFLALSFAVEKVQVKPGVIQTRPVQVTPMDLSDLVVDSIWLDSQCHINLKLKNSGKGSISDREHRESVVRVQFGSEIKDLLLGRIDPNGALKKAGGLVSFNTQIILKSSVDVKVIVDFNKKIRETEDGEKKNEMVSKLSPQCPTTTQTLKDIAKVQPTEGAKSMKSGAPLTTTPKIPPLPTGMTADSASGIMVMNPAQDSTWEWGKSYLIQWKSWPSALGLLKIVLYGEKGNQVQQIGMNQDNGTYNWKIPSNIPNGKYFIKISTWDNKVSGDSKVFYISDGKVIVGQLITGFFPISTITVTNPGKSDVWIPLKTYNLKWSWTVQHTSSSDTCGGTFSSCYGGCPVDVWLIPAVTSASAKKILLMSKICTPGNFSMGKITYSGEYGGVVPNLQPGNYIVRVTRSDKPDIYGDSQPFTVKSSLSSDTAFLGPDQTQGQVDLALIDVFFDGEGNISMKVQNLGDNYSGGLTISYQIFTAGMYNKLMKKDEFSTYLSVKAKEEKTVYLTGWGGFNFSTEGWDSGGPGIPSRFIPVNSRPLSVTVKITPAMGNDINPNNNQVFKNMCMIQAPDIGTNGEIKLVFSTKEWLYTGKGTTNEIHEAKLKWISNDTFEANVEVGLWNYGCTAKTFDCWLYVDKLPGQFLQKVTLQSGHVMKFNQSVKIKVPSKCGDHSLVFIADPDEHKNEPYPNSYMNNFINFTLRIICGGTIKGSGW